MRGRHPLFAPAKRDPADHHNEIASRSGCGRYTAPIPRAAGARLVTLTQRGYRRVCAAGVAATGEGCAVILFRDGNRADRVNLLAHMLVASIRAGTHDFVIGSRVRGEREADR